MTLAWSIGAALLPFCAAYAFIAVIWRDEMRTPAARALRLCLAAGLGMGLSSATYFLWMVTVGKPRESYLAFDSLLWIAVALAVLATRAGPRRATRSMIFEPRSAVFLRPTAGLFVLVLASAVAGLLGQTLAHPEGGWDAWAIWNLRARFLFRLGDDWHQALAGALDLPDYPLLVPAGLARWWTILGGESQAAAAVLAIAFTLATVALVTAAVGACRGMIAGLLAGMVLLGTVRFLHWGAAQYADVPLSFFFLATLSLLMWHDEHRPDSGRGAAWGCLFVAGTMAALAAWTKNEGLVFTAVIVAVRTAVVWREQGAAQSLREGLTFVAGAAPLIGLVLFFKSQVPYRNVLVAGQGLAETTGRLFDPARHWLVLQAFFASGVQLAHAFIVIVPICFLLLGRRRTAADGIGRCWLPAGVIGMMLAGYYGIYLMTPLDLAWHLSTSLGRLFVQLWPMTVCAVFMQLRSIEEDSFFAPCRAEARRAPRRPLVTGKSTGASTAASL